MAKKSIFVQRIMIPSQAWQQQNRKKAAGKNKMRCQ